MHRHMLQLLRLLLGVSRTVKGGRTVAHESRQIRAGANGGLVLIAEPSGENLLHDFPHRVAYRLDPPDTLHPRFEGQHKGQPRVIEFAPLRRAPCGTPRPC